MITAVIIGVSAVIGILTTLISASTKVARDIVRTKYGKQLQQVARKITPMLNANESLRNQVQNALHNQNSKLASDLLMASPLSSIIDKLNENIARNEQGIKDTDKYFDEQKEIAEKAERDAQSIQNALDNDIAGAVEGKHA